jgi:hypothetical protein
MLSKCANPGCSASFLYLHTGKLFLLEIARNSRPEDSVEKENQVPVRRLEYFWLCTKCCEEMTLTADRRGKLLIARAATRKAS